MAIAEKKKDKKYKGGPSRKSYLKSMARGGKRPIGTYAKSGDYDPRDVYTEKSIDYRGTTWYADTDPLMRYATAVYRGAGKELFVANGAIYKAPHGMNPVKQQDI